MKTPQIPPLPGCTPLGVKPANTGKPILDALINASELFDAPFNLAGEPLRSEIDAEGEARVRALAESEARKAQRALFEPAGSPYPNHRRCLNCETLVFKRNVATHDCWESRLSQQWPKSSNLVLRSKSNPG